MPKKVGPREKRKSPPKVAPVFGNTPATGGATANVPAFQYQFYNPNSYWQNSMAPYNWRYPGVPLGMMPAPSMQGMGNTNPYYNRGFTAPIVTPRLGVPPARNESGNLVGPYAGKDQYTQNAGNDWSDDWYYYGNEYWDALDAFATAGGGLRGSGWYGSNGKYSPDLLGIQGTGADTAVYYSPSYGTGGVTGQKAGMSHRRQNRFASQAQPGAQPGDRWQSTAYMDNKGRWNQVRDQYRRRHPSWVEQKQRKESKGKTSGLGITGAMTGSNASFNV